MKRAKFIALGVELGADGHELVRGHDGGLVEEHGKKDVGLLHFAKFESACQHFLG